MVKFHAIRIQGSNGITQWYNECGTGPLMWATLFPIRSASSDSDARSIFARLHDVFPGAKLHIAIIEVIGQWRIERDGYHFAEFVRVERRIVRDIVEWHVVE